MSDPIEFVYQLWNKRRISKHAYLSIKDAIEKLAFKLGQRDADVMMLSQKLDDWAKTYNDIIADGTCSSDEYHCACVPALREELDKLKAANEQLRKEKSLVWCAYCSAEFSGEDSLEKVHAHIAVCEFHPQRKLEERIKELESENADLRWVIGENSK